MAATMAAAVAGGLTGCSSTGQMAAAERADCPGKIICPITGELVCIDQCPAGAGEKNAVALSVMQPKSCCSAAK